MTSLKSAAKPLPTALLIASMYVYTNLCIHNRPINKFWTHCGGFLGGGIFAIVFPHYSVANFLLVTSTTSFAAIAMYDGLGCVIGHHARRFAGK